MNYYCRCCQRRCDAYDIYPGHLCLICYIALDIITNAKD